MATFEESDLLFTFPDDWTVRSFDGTRAYQSLSGHGLKGVDFIAISPDERLWLIEVKNYRPRRKGSKEYRANRKPPEVLAQQIAKKFTDSVRLIKIVNTYLRRSWHKRLLIWYRTRVSANPESNYWFWSVAHQLCTPDRNRDRAQKVEYVLWMETPEANRDYDLKLRVEISKRMPAGTSVTVAESDQPRALPFSAVPLAIGE
ncbi:hypothetical protein [Neolewinella antarctica]|uniref:NERD domain-containing protein n=1 Tax=Neolewinella antarctica TaxID=442734 RepID=A0ABX0X765_9BACT|nr:hypothetical protein [Neolewinella antarctica]NJC24839.1 hypothetical protein [Neolewinella antarctica]